MLPVLLLLWLQLQQRLQQTLLLPNQQAEAVLLMAHQLVLAQLVQALPLTPSHRSS